MSEGAIDDLYRAISLRAMHIDLSTELGVSGRFDAPGFKEAVERLERAILGAGIPLGGAALTRGQTQAILSRGYRLPVHGFDVLMLGALVRQTAEWRDTTRETT